MIALTEYQTEIEVIGIVGCIILIAVLISLWVFMFSKGMK